MTAIPSRTGSIPFRKEYRNTNLHAKRYTINGVERGVVAIPLGESDAAAGVFSWQNNEGSRILVERIIIDVTTKSDAACTIDVGTAATEIADDTLIDGLDVGTAAGVFDSVVEAGTNGKGALAVASGKYLTATKASGAAAGLVGVAYVFWIKPAA